MLNYTKVFGDLGALIARINSYATEASATLAADILTLLTQFGTTWLPEEGIAATYQGFQADVVNWRQTLAGFADQRLLNYDDVLVELNLDPSSGIDILLPALQRQMVYDAQSVQACTCAASAVTATAGNRGTGTAFPSLILDGYNPPLDGAAANLLYDEEPSQLCVPSETMTLTCTADSTQDGLAEGGEEWAWTGAPNLGAFDYHPEGSGTAGGIATANANSLAQGGDFESFASGVPDGWTLDAGNPANVSQDTTTYFRGASSLLVTGDGSGFLQLGQSIAPSTVQSARRYLLSLALRASTPFSAGAVVLAFQSALTDYRPGAGEAIYLPGTEMAAAWTIYAAAVNMPTPVAPDWRLVLQFQGLPPGVQIWVDSLVFAPIDYHGGVGLGIVAGSVPWQKGDRLSFSVSNDGAGLLQTFFRQQYQIQLRSSLTGTYGTALTLPFLLLTQTLAPTIPDSLVH